MAASKAGSASSRTERSLFFDWVEHFARNLLWEASSLISAPASPSSATGRIAQGVPTAVRAMTSASISSVFATPGNMSRARFIDRPGR